MKVYFIFWAPEFGRPCRYTGIKILLDTLLCNKDKSVNRTARKIDWLLLRNTWSMQETT